MSAPPRLTAMKPEKQQYGKFFGVYEPFVTRTITIPAARCFYPFGGGDVQPDKDQPVYESPTYPSAGHPKRTDAAEPDAKQWLALQTGDTISITGVKNGQSDGVVVASGRPPKTRMFSRPSRPRAREARPTTNPD